MNITAPIVTENINRQERYLVALVEDQKVVFPALLVQEIFVFGRSQILTLPFYDRSLLGVVHHHNEIVPLVSGRAIFGGKTQNISQAKVTAVRLNQLGENFAGVGIVVDRMVENLLAKELSQERLFQLTDIPAHIWQPRR